jgi:hypothetical protein
LKRLQNDLAAFLVHFDVDKIEQAEFPAANVPQGHGVSVAAAQVALGVVTNSSGCAGVVITELNAERNADGGYGPSDCRSYGNCTDKRLIVVAHPFRSGFFSRQRAWIAKSMACER